MEKLIDHNEVSKMFIWNSQINWIDIRQFLKKIILILDTILYIKLAEYKNKYKTYYINTSIVGRYNT